MVINYSKKCTDGIGAGEWVASPVATRQQNKPNNRDIEPLAGHGDHDKVLVHDMERPQTRRGNSDTNTYWENSETNEGGGGTESGTGTASGSLSRPLTRMVTICF